MHTDKGPVRALAWAAPDLGPGGDAGAARSVFATTGHSTALTIWDARWAGSRAGVRVSVPSDTLFAADRLCCCRSGRSEALRSACVLAWQSCKWCPEIYRLVVADT